MTIISLMDLPNMREVVAVIDSLLKHLPDDGARATCSSSFIVAGAMALRFYASGPVTIHQLRALADAIVECDAEDAERIMQ